jgi:hypothetical protein
MLIALIALLGVDPDVIRVATGGATVEVAAHGHDIELLLGPYAGDATSAAAAEEP